MKPAVAAEPGVVVKARVIHYQRVSFPAANGIAVIGSVQIGSMSTPIGRNEAREISRLSHIKEHDPSFALHDSRRRTHTRHTRRMALDHRIQPVLVAIQLPYFCVK